MNNEPKSLLNEFIIPHIALTAFKYRAKGASLLKEFFPEITPDQFVILKILTQYPGISQQELATMLYKDKSNFSRMVEDLEKKGFLSRNPDLKGKRVIKTLTISKKGNDLVQKMIPLATQFQSFAIKEISDEELNILKKILAKIRNNLNCEIKIDLHKD